MHWYSEVGIGADDANHQTKDLQVQSSQPGTGNPERDLIIRGVGAKRQ